MAETMQARQILVYDTNTDTILYSKSVAGGKLYPAIMEGVGFAERMAFDRMQSLGCPVGDTIYTTIEVIQEVFNITLIRAVCRVNDVEIATCKMKIFLDTDEAKS